MKYTLDDISHPIFWLWNLGPLYSEGIPFLIGFQTMLDNQHVRNAALKQHSFNSLELIVPDDWQSARWNVLLLNIRLLYPNLTVIRCSGKHIRLPELIHIPSPFSWEQCFGGLRQIKLDLKMKVSVA